MSNSFSTSSILPFVTGSTTPQDDSSPPAPPGEGSGKSAPPPSSEGDDSPPSTPPPPPSSESASPPLTSPPPPPSSKSSPPPSPPPPSKSPPSPPSPSPPPPSKAPPNASAPPPSSSVSPPPTVFVPPPASQQASPPPPPPSPEIPSTAPPPPGVTLSPPVPGAAILSPPPPVEVLIPSPTLPATNVPPTSPGLVPPPPAEIPLTPPGSASPPISRGSTSGHSSSASSNAKSSNISNTSPAEVGGNSSTRVVAGGIVAAAVLLGLIALFFVVRGRRKRQKPYASHYMPPNSFTVNTDGFYFGQTQHPMGFSGPATHSYGSQPPRSVALEDSFGSQMGNLYNGGRESGVISSSKSFFSHDEVMEMTNGFARQNIIGEGGFGCVYKGLMPDGRVVAVKQLKAGSGQGDREFKAEVEIISRVHHRHLVSLVGYSISDRQRLLIYEYVPNKTLEHHLHAKGSQVLDWPKRLKIAIGSAKGLAYLHEDCHPKIIHRDIKSANILLDDDFEAQVADFGLARLNDTAQTHVSTRVMGTFGYLAPEYASSGKLTDRSDVFSFGVVLLELITGRKPVDPTQPLGDESLVEWARPHLVRAVETGDLSEVVDPQLEKHYVESEMFRMVETAVACVRHSAPKRPRMVQVVRALDCESEISDLSNGAKYGQSTVYDSGVYNQEIMQFRRMALGSKENLDFNTYSGESMSSESETRAMNQPVGDHRHGGGQSHYSSLHFK